MTFWDFVPLIVVEIDRRFRGTYASVVNVMIKSLGVWKKLKQSSHTGDSGS
jgi:hypothetical protein